MGTIVGFLRYLSAKPSAPAEKGGYMIVLRCDRK